ncbi:MAG: hypothetical protein AAB664_04145, partial [Patescibacteria group bacterium]
MSRQNKFLLGIFFVSLFSLGAFIGIPDTFAEEKAPTQFITPILNVDIPGLKFTSTVSGPCPYDAGQTCIKSNFLADYLTGVYQFLIGASIAIAIVMVMIGGLQYVFSAGGADAGKAKTRISNATIGLTLLLSVYLILYTVNPKLTILDTVSLQNIPPEGLGNNEVTSLEDANASYPSVSVTAGQLPQFKQCGGQWKNFPYKGPNNKVVLCGPNKKHSSEFEDNICESGCGPTSVAVVLGYYGLQVSPPIFADFAASIGAHQSCSSGTSMKLLCDNIEKKWT